jgi:prepilin-type N-terminal cleavage/methylation domain-containing protein
LLNPTHCSGPLSVRGPHGHRRVPRSVRGPDARRRGGFTLIELLVAIVAMGFVLIYTLGTFTYNRNAYTVIDQVSEAHQNTLAIASLIERDIRNAGYMVPDAAAACGRDNTTAPDILVVSDADAIRPADNLPSDLAGKDLGATVTSSITTLTGTATVTLDDLLVDEQATYDIDATAGADSDFRPQGGIILTNVNDPDTGVFCGVVNSVNPASNQIQFTLLSLPLTTAILGADWQAVPAHVYRINAATLTRDGVPMASDVEDLQVAWFFDIDGDGRYTGSEYRGINLTDLLDTDGGVDPGTLREIRFNLVVRTSEDDPANPTAAGAGQARENRTNAPGADGRRRRVHTSTIRLRNLIP